MTFAAFLLELTIFVGYPFILLPLGCRQLCFAGCTKFFFKENSKFCFKFSSSFELHSSFFLFNVLRVHASSVPESYHNLIYYCQKLLSKWGRKALAILAKHYHLLLKKKSLPSIIDLFLLTVHKLLNNPRISYVYNQSQLQFTNQITNVVCCFPCEHFPSLSYTDVSGLNSKSRYSSFLSSINFQQLMIP